MSALGQKYTFAVQKGLSALRPKADMCGASRDVRYGPEADMAQIEISLGPPINYNYRVSLPVRKIATRTAAMTASG